MFDVMLSPFASLRVNSANHLGSFAQQKSCLFLIDYMTKLIEINQILSLPAVPWNLIFRCIGAI
jgi:hypothetical protein